MGHSVKEYLQRQSTQQLELVLQQLEAESQESEYSLIIRQILEQRIVCQDLSSASVFAGISGEGAE